MSVVGTGVINITPKFPGLSASIKKELGKYDGTASGTQAGNQYAQGFTTSTSKGLGKSGAIIGAFAAITNSAMSSIASNIGNAIKRFDTLNNYPVVMQSLGYSAQAANSSIQKMSDHLTGLPTALDSMTGTVQGIVAITGNLDQATDAGLALNDMLLASGSNTQVANAAMEQFRQMLSKGKPDMQDWKSLVSAMPGQMNQLAQAMLGAGATANDLYTALGGGGAKATITTEQLLEKMIELDTQGGDGITSFAEQAKTATGGVATSMENMGTAITRGLTSILDAIGKDTISGVFKEITTTISSAFKVISSGVSQAMPTVKTLYAAIKQFAPQIVTTLAAFQGMKSVTGIFQQNAQQAGTLAAQLKNVWAANKNNNLSGLRNGINNVVGSASVMKSTLASALKSIASPANIAMVGVTALAAAISVGIGAYQTWKTNADNAKKATQGLSDAVANTGALSGYSATLSSVGETAKTTALSLSELNSSIASSVDKMNETTKEAETQISSLNTVQSILTEFAGKTDLSTEAQGKLKWAISQFNELTGESVALSDVMANSYQNQAGETLNLTDSVNALIEAKKQEIKMQAYEQNYTEVLTQQAEANKTYAQAVQNRSSRIDELAQSYIAQNSAMGSAVDVDAMYAMATKAVDAEIEQAKQSSENLTASAKDLEAQMGDLSQSTSENASEWDKWGNKMDEMTSGRFSALLSDNGGLAALKKSLSDLGIDASSMANLNEDALTRIASAYDGSGKSIIGVLQSLGIQIDNTKLAVIESAQEMENTLKSFSTEAGGSLDNIDINGLATKLAEAGVSTETLNQIGSENIAALAQSCNNDMNKMAAAIEMYNTQPLIDKEGNVVINDAKLTDAQGNIYTWNGSQLIDQYGNAAINDTEVTDAQGNLWLWNGSELKYQSTDGVVNDRMRDGIISRDTWNKKGLNSYEATGRINIFHNIIETVSRVFTGNAQGGIRPHASGGIIPRYHAKGAIATRAVPLDIVGEAGAEAIVPLTNKRYSQPFVNLIADAISSKSKQEQTTIVQNFNNKIVRSDADMYSAATIINRSALRTASGVK